MGQLGWSSFGRNAALREQQEGNTSPLPPRMVRSTSSHKRRCYFTPQGLSSTWCHCPRQGPANQAAFPSTTSLPPPHTMPQAEGNAPEQPLKETASSFQHASWNKVETFSSAKQDDDMWTDVLSSCCKDFHLIHKLTTSCNFPVLQQVFDLTVVVCYTYCL